MGLRERRGVAARRSRVSRAAARAVRRGPALAMAALLVSAAAALAAEHFRASATYTGRSCSASSFAPPGTTCVFKFRASGDGLSLRFVGKTVIDTWGCGQGGGEALLGGEAKYAAPIPLVKVRPSGKLYGSVSYVFTPTSAPPEHLKVTVTGQLATSGRTATITFHQTSSSGSGTRGCATQPVTLRER